MNKKHSVGSQCFILRASMEHSQLSQSEIELYWPLIPCQGHAGLTGSWARAGRGPGPLRNLSPARGLLDQGEVKGEETPRHTQPPPLLRESLH